MDAASQITSARDLIGAADTATEAEVAMSLRLLLLLAGGCFATALVGCADGAKESSAPPQAMSAPGSASSQGSNYSPATAAPGEVASTNGFVPSSESKSLQQSVSSRLETTQSAPQQRMMGGMPGSAGAAAGEAAPTITNGQPDYEASKRLSRSIKTLPDKDASRAKVLSKAPSPRAAYNPNLYLSDTYSAGAGERDRIEKLIREGVEVDGKRVKLASFPRAYRQTFPMPTGKALGLNTATESAKIIERGDRTYLQVGLQAMKGEKPRRPALNIALVIDRSGSMDSDDKLPFAIRAATDAIGRLHRDDYVSVVTFDDEAQVLVPATTDHARARKKTAAIVSGGGTNIYDGLRLGYAEVAKHSSRDGVNLVLLLSDGEVTAGNSDPEAFRKMVEGQADREIQTSSIGMGVEFNEELMQAVARTGGGSYHFVKDGADATTVFAKELDDLGEVVARAVKVRIVLAKDVGFVCALGQNVLDSKAVQATRRQERKIDQKVYDELGITRNRKEDEPGIKMLIPNFRRGDSHVVMLEIQAPKGRGDRKLADVHLKYKDLVYRANREEAQAVTVQYASDRGQVVASINRAVKKNLLGFQTGEALTLAAAAIENGKPADAVRLIDDRMTVLGVAAREWSDRDLDRDGALLDKYRVVLGELHRRPQLASADLGQYLSKSLSYAGYQMTR
jgi:Mg-chelatase subunit ChlD